MLLASRNRQGIVDLEDDSDKLRAFVERYISRRCHDILYEINRSRTIPSD